MMRRRADLSSAQAESSFEYRMSNDARIHMTLGIAELLIIRHGVVSCRIARVDGKGVSHLLEGGNARRAM